MSFRSLACCILAVFAVFSTGVLATYPEEYKDYYYHYKPTPTPKPHLYPYTYPMPYENPQHYGPYPYPYYPYYYSEMPPKKYTPPKKDRQSKKIGINQMKSQVYPRTGSVAFERMQKYMNEDGTSVANKYCYRILGYPCYYRH